MDSYTYTEIEDFGEFDMKLRFEKYESYILRKREEIQREIKELAQQLITQGQDSGQISTMDYLKRIDYELVSTLNQQRKKVLG